MPDARLMPYAMVDAKGPDGQRSLTMAATMIAVVAGLKTPRYETGAALVIGPWALPWALGIGHFGHCRGQASTGIIPPLDALTFAAAGTPARRSGRRRNPADVRPERDAAGGLAAGAVAIDPTPLSSCMQEPDAEEEDGRDLDDLKKEEESAAASRSASAGRARSKRP